MSIKKIMNTDMNKRINIVMFGPGAHVGPGGAVLLTMPYISLLVLTREGDKY
jgi:hypothetical protein